MLFILLNSLYFIYNLKDGTSALPLLFKFLNLLILVFVSEVPVKKSSIPSPDFQNEKLDNPFGGGGGGLFRSYLRRLKRGGGGVKSGFYHLKSLRPLILPSSKERGSPWIISIPKYFIFSTWATLKLVLSVCNKLRTSLDMKFHSMLYIFFHFVDYLNLPNKV